MKAFRYADKPITRAGAWAQVPMDAYHGGALCDGFSISGTGLSKVLRSPQHYFAVSPLNPTRGTEKKSDALEFGKAAHCLALEPEKFDAEFVVSEFEAFTTKEARVWRDGQTRQVVRQSDMVTIQGMAAALRRHPDALALFRDGLAELTFVAKDDPTGIWLLARPDFTPSAAGRGLVSYKTAITAEAEAWSRSAFNFAYPLKTALALDVVSRAIGETRPTVWEVVQEKEEPWVVQVLRWEPDQIAYGRGRVRDALDVLARCMERHAAGEPDAWPAYSTEPVSVVTPRYLQREMEAMA